MLFNITLAISFLSSVLILWYRVSEKIPELIAIPDTVIFERLHEDSARIRIFLLHLKTFWREPQYQEAFRGFCEKILSRIHIALMRMDNGVNVLLKNIRSSNPVSSSSPPIPELPPTPQPFATQDMHIEAPKKTYMSGYAIPHKRVQEVRRKKKSPMRLPE